jgi:predicted permease
MSFAREFGHSVWTDVIYGARMLRTNPTFTVIALLSLTVGIGANTATFSTAKRLIYDRLNVPRPQELRILLWFGDENVAVHSFIGDVVETHGTNIESGSFSFPVYKILQQRFATLFAFKDFEANATINGMALQVEAVMVSGNYYAALEITPQIGRPIQNTDSGTPGAGAVAVISDELWRRDFDASPKVIGQTILLNHVHFTVIGVNPRGFIGTKSIAHPPAIFVPISMQSEVLPMAGSASELDDPNLWWVNVMTRMQPEIQDTRASAALNVELTSAVRATMTLNSGEHIPRLLLISGSRGLQGIGNVKKPLSVMAAMLLLVLLLACANIATMLLARASERQREVGIRLVLGATRLRLLRQSLTESMLLAFFGGAGGLLLGYFTRGLIPRLLVDPESMTFDVPFDWGVCAFAAAVTIGTAMFFGWAPALALSRVQVATSLKETAQTASRRRGLGPKVIVGIQLALATCLLIGAGLFLRTVMALTSVDVGFKTKHLLLLEVDPPSSEYTLTKKAQLYRSLEDAFSAIPGVRAVTVMSVPYIARYTLTTMFVTEAEAATLDRRPGERITAVGNSFFRTMGIPIVAGRGFTEGDTATAQPVAIINSSLAHKRFPGLDPIGQKFKFGIPIKDQWVEVVGVCRDTRYMELRESVPPQFFVPYVQRPKDAEEMTYAARTDLSTSIILPSLRRAAATIDPNLPLVNVRTQQEQIDANMRVEQSFGAATGSFALMALILASVGVYGIMSYSVASRTKDLGIRLALGAQPRNIQFMILRESGVLAMVFICFGAVSALMLTRFIRSMLYEVGAHDPATILGAVTALLAIAVAAAWVPARRASNIQPVEAMRQE